MILANTIPSFKDVDVKLNGQLHSYIVNKLERYFQESCGDNLEQLDKIINEIAPVEDMVKEDLTTSSLRFECELHSNNQTYFYENLRNSLKSSKAKKIIADIETDLVSSIKKELQIDTEILVRKWKVGSLFIDITIIKMDQTHWDSKVVPSLIVLVQSVLSENIPNDVASVQRNGHIAVNIQEGVEVFGTISMNNCNYEKNVIRLFKKLEGAKFPQCKYVYIWIYLE